MAVQCLEQRGVVAVVREKTTTEKEVSLTVESNNLVMMVKRWILVLVAAALMATAMLLVPAASASAGEENFGRLASANARSLDRGVDAGLGLYQSGYALFHGPYGCYDVHENVDTCPST